MVYAQIEDLLKRVTGLEAESVGHSAVKRAVQARAAACEIDVHVYLQRLRTSDVELQALIDAVVVPETWFFRDSAAFAALTRMAHADWLSIDSRETLRLLSLPCSTGEEPYSMAMALLDAGFPAERLRIDAVDISTRALAQAKRGVYGKNSFRGAELGFRERYFDATAAGQLVRDSVRMMVDFQCANLFAVDFLPDVAVYDMIFCRNLLIYFGDATQTRAINVLQRLLKPEGVLFVGPAEAGLLLNRSFKSAKVPLAFAFRKPQAVACAPQATCAPVSHRHASRPKLATAAAVTRILPLSSAVQIAARHSAQAAAQPDPVPLESGLEQASGLADQGRLVEAAQCCEEHLRLQGPSVQAFHLMGLIHSALGNLAEASQHYRKALYLDQNHHDTLLHLGLLLERQGDAGGAQVLRGRLRRLDRKGVT